MDNLRRELLDKYDPDELVSILNITGEELLERFPDKVEEYEEGYEEDPEDMEE